MEHCEVIRRAYYVEKKSVRQIAHEVGCSRKTVDKALTSATPTTYTRTVPYASPKIDPFKARIAELLAERAQQPLRPSDHRRPEGAHGPHPHRANRLHYLSESLPLRLTLLHGGRRP